MFGIAGFPYNALGDSMAQKQAVMNQIIAFLNEHNLDFYRMNIPLSQSASTAIQWATYFLDHSDNINLIINSWHLYPQGSLSDFTPVYEKAMAIVAALQSYGDRVWIELINECTNTDLAQKTQVFVDMMRAAGYSNNIVCNRQTQEWAHMTGVQDPLGKFWTGSHPYFDNFTAQTMINSDQSALNLGLKLFNTEVGADTRESSYFTASKVSNVNAFLEWCSQNGVGGVVHMLHGLENLAAYEANGLQFPESPTPPPPSPVPILPLYGFGGDYCLYYDSNSVERWLDYWAEIYASDAPGFNVMRLMVELPNCQTNRKSNVSTYDKTKFLRVCEIFAGLGCKVAPVIWNDAPFDTAFQTAFIQFCNDVKDAGLASVSVFNEVTPSNLNGHSREEFMQVANMLVRQARQILNIEVVYPCLAFLVDGTHSLGDLIDLSCCNEQGIILDVCHPYYFENSNDMGLSPEQKAQYYKDNWLLPALSKLDASLLWVGETFGWTSKTDDLQIRFLGAMLSTLDDLGISYNMQSHSSYRTINLAGLEAASGYVPPLSEIHFIIEAGPGGSVELPGLHIYPLDSMQTFTATPDAGMQFYAWLLNGQQDQIELQYNSTVTLKMVAAYDNDTLTATFKEAPTPPKSGFGIYYLLPVKLLHKLWKLRQKYVGDEWHRKLHPLI